MDHTRRGLCGLALAASLVLTGCSGVPGFNADDPSGAPSPVATTPVAAPSSAASPAPKKPSGPVRNDLKTNAVKRTFEVSGLTVSVDYSTTLPTAKWTPDVSKPLNVSLTASRNSSKAQKIYLTRVRANIRVSDGSGQLDAPEPQVDTANISPGFIVTFPYTYGQVFVIPAVDSGATTLTLDFTYEFLLQVTPSSKDYAKQTGRDSLTIALT